MDSAELKEALVRADKLIEWMSNYIGSMAPGDYFDCFSDLNKHYIFMHNLKVEEQKPNG